MRGRDEKLNSVFVLFSFFKEGYLEIKIKGAVKPIQEEKNPFPSHVSEGASLMR